MKRHHLRTLQALFAHPLQHGVRVSRVEALFHALGAEVRQRDDRRLQIRMPSGQETWIHLGAGLHQPDLDAEAVMRVRHFLEEAGITPAHPEPEPVSPRGDQSHRLVLHLDHHRTDLYRLDGEEADHAVLRPHGIGGTEERPVSRQDLAPLIGAITEADAVLLLGHGTGESDMRQVLLHELAAHHHDLLKRIVGVVTLDDGGISDEQLLAVAREHFGNLPHRRPLVIPGQDVVAV